MLLAIFVFCFIVCVIGFIVFCWYKLFKFVSTNVKSQTATDNSQECSDSDSEFESALKHEVNDFIKKRSQKRRRKTKHVLADGGLKG